MFGTTIVLFNDDYVLAYPFNYILELEIENEPYITWPNNVLIWMVFYAQTKCIKIE